MSEILRPAPFALLNEALDAAVAGDASLAGARMAVLSPLLLLAAAGRDAPAALGDDVIAGERLRLLLSLAETQAGSASLLSAVMESELKDVLAGKKATPAPCPGGLLDAGVLVIVALAAARSGEAVGLAEPLMQNVLGLALAAGPGETLARAAAHGMAPDQFRAALAAMGTRAPGTAAITAAIGSFMSDPCERARWLCLISLFRQVRLDVAGIVWDASPPRVVVESVTPLDACAGDLVTLQLAPEQPEGDEPQPPVSIILAASVRRGGAAVALSDVIDPDEVRVVFAAPRRRSLGRKPVEVDLANGTVRVRAPARAQPGWVGITTAERQQRANAERTSLRAAWAARNEAWPCLRGSPVPLDAIATLPDPATPPRSAGARFGGGVPLVAYARLSPSRIEAGEQLELTWRVEGATEVAVEPSPGIVDATGVMRLAANAGSQRIEFAIVARNACGQESRGLVRSRHRGRLGEPTLTQEGVGAPLIEGVSAELVAPVLPADARGAAVVDAGDSTRRARVSGGRIVLTLPGSVVTDGRVLRLRLFGPDGELDDEREIGPLAVRRLATRHVVLLRPAFVARSLERVGDAEARAALAVAGRMAALDIAIREPAWLEDEELSFDSPPEAADLPIVDTLLERMNVLAARHPGLEDAIWIAVVPPPPTGQPFHRIEPADAARAVAVASPGTLAALLAEPVPELRPRTMRLRLVALLDADDTVWFESVRVEPRAAGPGAPLATSLAAVAAAGSAERVRVPLRALSAGRPARIVSLVPVPPEANVLDVRNTDPFAAIRNGAVADPRRLRRPAGAPELRGVDVQRSAVSWRYRHTRSARATFVVEVGRDDVWCPIARVGACNVEATVPLELLPARDAPDRIRVVATDGWNTAISRPRALSRRRARRRVLARYAGGLRFWADVDDDHVAITWTFDGRTADGPVLELARAFDGEVVLEVRGRRGVARDRRRIHADGRVEPRAIRWLEDGWHG